jgi:ABC-type Fe2+-enterobactin transport system substrate-binding protein
MLTFMRDNWLSNRIFKSFDDIVDHCCDTWNKLIDQLGQRDGREGRREAEDAIANFVLPDAGAGHDAACLRVADFANFAAATETAANSSGESKPESALSRRWRSRRDEG